MSDDGISQVIDGNVQQRVAANPEPPVIQQEPPQEPAAPQAPATPAAPAQTQQQQAPAQTQQQQPQHQPSVADLVKQRQRAREAEERFKKLEQDNSRLMEELNRVRQIPQAPQIPGQQPQADPLRQFFSRYEQELQALRQQMEEQQTISYQSTLETQLEKMQSKYPEMRRLEVLTALQADPEMNLEELCKASHGEITAWKDKIVEEYIKKKTSDSTRPPVQRGGAPQGVHPKKFNTIEEASAAAREHLDQMMKEGTIG